jgi:pilus assembly protein CpaC
MMKRLLILFSLVLLSGGPQAWADATPALKISVDHGVPLTLSSPASSVFIANPDIADVQVMSPTSIMIFGKRTGETTFMASDSNGHTLAQRTIVVLQDLSDLRQELDAAIPGNKIKVQSLPNGIVLMGEARDPAAVADAYKLAQRYLPASGGDIINRIKVVGSNQIHIRVRFAEVSRSVDSTLGIDWQSSAKVGGFLFGLGTGNPVYQVANGTTPATIFPRPNNSSLTTSNDVVGLSRTGQRLNINGMLDALTQDGLVTILAEPNLTAMSGETASFLAGGEIPVPIPQTSSGSGTVITVEWKQYGISLEFTPTLISESRISLHVKPEVSQLTNIGSITTDSITIPGLTTRKAETTVEIASGESFAIAGLLDNSQSQTIDKLPLLGDLPILGPLFRSNHFQNGQSELVVVITPYIVRPNGEQPLALSTDGYSPPNETERFIGMRYSSSDPNARPMSGEPLAKQAASPTATLPEAPAAAPVTEVMPAPSESAPALQAAVPGPSAVPIAAPSPVHAPIAISPSRSAPLPLRGGSDSGSSTMAPLGPGGFIVE